MRYLTIPLLAVVLVACQVGPPNTRPVPSVRQIGSDLKCPNGDHGYEDQAGWGFCYPATWQYTLKSQSTTNPSPELDLLFDITNVPTFNGRPLPPCPSPSPGPAGQATSTPSAQSSPAIPRCAPDAGLFGVMIVSTYTRNNAPDLSGWVQSNLRPPLTFDTMSWGNAVEAGRLSDGRRIALTPLQVVILDLHPGNLDLEGAMSSRLSTWKFTV